MEKLTREYLAPYLPYDLMMQGLNENGTSFFYMDGIYGSKGTVLIVPTDRELGHFLMSQCKPYLRPLSDLTKEIEHNGERFVPIDYNAFKHSKDEILEYQNGFIHWRGMKFGIIQRLFEWHFDVFGLIGKGPAIDTNSTK